MAATGVRISELVKFQVEDVLDGFKDIYSKGNKMRRVYIPITLRKAALQWLQDEKRKKGSLFLNRFEDPISASGIRNQLKNFAFRYHIDPEVM